MTAHPTSDIPPHRQSSMLSLCVLFGLRRVVITGNVNVPMLKRPL